MAVPQNIQSVALQFEAVRDTVPKAFGIETTLMDLIGERDVIDASTRNIRLPEMIRPGGKGSQGTADFDDMGLGSGSTWEVGTLTTMQQRWAIEISKLAEYATKGKEKALEDVVTRENAEAVDNFKNYLDTLYNQNGTGQLDTIQSISGNVLTVTNPNMFYFNQDIQDYPSGLASASRGLMTVTAVDPLAKTITVNALPAGCVAGDALVINISQGAGGANPVSIEGLLYNHVDSQSGTWNNVPRASYPEALKTPHVAAASSAITPALARLIFNKMRRALQSQMPDDLVAYMNVDQEAAWENCGLVVSQIIYNQLEAESSPDMLKKQPPKTFAGRKALTSTHATIARIDVISPKHWGKGVTKPFGLYEEGGQTVFQLYGGSGGLLAGYAIYYDIVFNVFMDQPRYGGFADGLATPPLY